jgi:leader peptidase (prepilin peptidase)/N-methyltransferase
MMMLDEVVILIFAALLGLALGSFLNVCVLRLPRGESILAPPSHCMACQTPIRVRDNVPVLSWVLLRGCCRDCKAAISIRYPLVELGSGLIFGGCTLLFGANLRGAGMAIFCWMLFGLALMDAETFLLPNAFTVPGIGLGLLYSGLISADGVVHGMLSSLLGAAAIGGFLWLISLLYQLIRRRSGMGLGDVKLGAMLGAWMGWQMGAVALFIGILGGAVAGVVVAMRHRQESGLLRTGDRRLPFGTFLAGGGIVSVFAGKWLLRWYLSFFP